MPEDESLKTSTDARPRSDALEELAEDMLDVVQRLSSLERLMQNLATEGAESRRLAQEAAIYQARAIETMRSDVAGERRGLALKLMFEPIANALDSLDLFRQGLDPARDETAHAQLTAASATLANLLLALGFDRFEVARGDGFDPNRMQCLGFAEGEPGIVLAAVQPGYMCAQIVMRPARVLISDPAQRAQEPSGA